MNKHRGPQFCFAILFVAAKSPCDLRGYADIKIGDNIINNQERGLKCLLQQEPLLKIY